MSNEIKVGDKVIVHYPNGDRIGRIQEEMLDGTYDIDYGGGCTGHNITRSQIETYTAPKFKVGDRVRNIKNGLIGVVDKIVYGNIAWVNGVDGKRYHWKSDELELIEPTEQTEGKNQAFILGEKVVTPYGYGVVGKDFEGRIAVALEYGGFCGIDKAIKIVADSPVFNWDAYAADLAKEVALKVTNKFNDPCEAAKYAVTVAKAVVEGLKRK